MSKFTPGKWEVDGFGQAISVFDEREEATLFIVDHVYSWANRDGEAEANARLIAAAPEMYRLLKEELIPTSDYDGILSFSREAKIRAVLARIDGEEEITAHEGTE